MSALHAWRFIFAVKFVVFIVKVVAHLASKAVALLAPKIDSGCGRRWPNLERWFEAMEARPTFMGLRSDYFTHCHDLPPQLGGALASDEAPVD